jgi:hypothetical protein
MLDITIQMCFIVFCIHGMDKWVCFFFYFILFCFFFQIGIQFIPSDLFESFRDEIKPVSTHSNKEMFDSVESLII